MTSKMAAKVSTQLQSLVEGVDKELTCAICLSRYTNPKLLPCLHSYCKGCLEDLLKKSHGEKKHITCPQCQEVHQLPENGIDGFKTYFTINNLIELLQIHEAAKGSSEKLAIILCQSGLDAEGDAQPAFARCLTCSHYLCESCVKFHRRQNITKGHDVITLTEIQKAEKKKGIRSLQRKQYCEEHEDEIIKLFCNTCKKAICRDCALVKHKDHDFNLVRELRPNVQELLEKLMAAVQAKETEFVSHKKYAEDLRMLSKSALEVCTKQVKEAYKNILSQLEAHQTTLIAELNDIHEAESKQIDAEETSLSLALVRFANSIRFTQQLLDNGDDVEVMSMSVQAQETLQTLGKMMWNRETLKPTLLRMKFDPEFTNVKPFGTVVHEIEPENIIVKKFPERFYVNTNVKFAVELSSDISERGYKASPNALVAMVIQNGQQVPITVENLGINCWTLSFIPSTDGLYTITIKCGTAKKVLEKSVSVKYNILFGSKESANKPVAVKRPTKSDSFNKPASQSPRTYTPMPIPSSDIEVLGSTTEATDVVDKGDDSWPNGCEKLEVDETDFSPSKVSLMHTSEYTGITYEKGIEADLFEKLDRKQTHGGKKKKREYRRT